MDLLKIQIDNTKVDISNTLQKLDLSMQGNYCDVERAAADFEDLFPKENEFPEVSETDYVRKVNNGFKVWDGMRWVQLSEKANINVEIFQNPDNDNRPAVRVWAKDSQTDTSVVFIDNDLEALGWGVGYTRTGDNFDSEAELAAMQRGGYYEDPFYKVAKNSIGIGGSVTGALELRHVGNMTPWRTGYAFKNANGWYRNAEGIYQNLNKQRGMGADGYQKSTQRALSKAKVFKEAGKILLGAGIFLSGYDIYDAHRTQDINRNEIYTKATVDIVIGVIGAAGGPVGWVIAGTYFILDVSGAFGDWGQPSGISQDDYNEYLSQKIQHEYGNRISSLKFEVNYVAPIEQTQKEIYLEERTMRIDNARIVMPKILFHLKKPPPLVVVMFFWLCLIFALWVNIGN